MNIADLDNPVLVPPSLIPKETQKIGLSGPGSKDENPSDVVTAKVPEGPKDIPSHVASGAVESVKSMGRGAGVLLGEASPVGSEGLKVPFSGLNDPSKRRELERGASDVVTGGLAQKIANKVSPELKATEESDAKSAPNYRDAGGLAGGFLPNPLGYAAGKTIEASGAGIRTVAEKLNPGAESRIANRTIDDLARGAGRPARVELGTVRKEIKEIIKTDPELAAKPKDANVTGDAIDKALEARTSELDQRYKSATDKYVSDGVPQSEIHDTTTPIGHEPMSAIPKKGKALEPEPQPLLEGNVPKELPESFDTTQKIKNEPMKQLTDGKVAPSEKIDSPVIEMRPNGSLLPHEVKASIIDKANELERKSAPQSDAVTRIHENLEREINAEIKATHDDPSLRWWRQKATDLQHVGHKHAIGAAESENQAAHLEVANVIRDALEKHMQDPEINRLNAEVSALMKLKKVNDQRILNQNEAGKSPGKYGGRLAGMFKGTADAIAVTAALATHSPLPMIVPAAIHGAPIAASMADRMIARIASEKSRGGNPERLIAQALKSGISQSQIDDTLKKVK